MKDFSSLKKGDFLVHFHRSQKGDESLPDCKPYIVEEVCNYGFIYVRGAVDGEVVSDLHGWIPENWEKIVLEPFQEGDVLIRHGFSSNEFVFQRYDINDQFGYLIMRVINSRGDADSFNREIEPDCITKSPFSFLTLKGERQQQGACNCGSTYQDHVPHGIHCLKGL